MIGTSPCYLVIDQGGHASRALVFDSQGHVLAMHSLEIETRRDNKGRVEHDPESLVASITNSIEAVIASTGVNVNQIESAGIATQRSSIVCWDRNTGKALSPVISWQDRRTAAAMPRYSGQAGLIHELTGLRLSPHYGATKLKWCLDKLPDVGQAYREGRLACGPLSSFILFRLIDGNPLVVDPANASRTLLWNYQTHGWDAQLLDLFEVPEAILPRCVPNRYEYGHIAVKTRQIPVTVVSGDQSAALFALGKPRTDTTYINIGTGAFLQRPVGGKPVESANLLGSVVWQAEAETVFVLEGTVNGAGSALHKFAAEAGLDEHEFPTGIAEALLASSNPPLFLNGVSGLGSPFWEADFVSCFVGEGDVEEKLAAVIESIVFLIRANLDEMTEITGRSKQLVVTGGLSVVDGLCQRLANLSGISVKRPQIEEATAQGMLYLLAGASGPVSRTTSFPAETDNALRLRYRDWLKRLIDSLRDQ